MSCYFMITFAETIIFWRNIYNFFLLSTSLLTLLFPHKYFPLLSSLCSCIHLLCFFTIMNFFFIYTHSYRPTLLLSMPLLPSIPWPSFPSLPFPSFISQPCVFLSPFGLFPETLRFLPSHFFSSPSSNSSSLPLHLHISWSTFRPLHQLPAASLLPFPVGVWVLSLLQGLRLPPYTLSLPGLPSEQQPPPSSLAL